MLQALWNTLSNLGILDIFSSLRSTGSGSAISSFFSSILDLFGGGTTAPSTAATPAPDYYLF